MVLRASYCFFDMAGTMSLVRLQAINCAEQRLSGWMRICLLVGRLPRRSKDNHLLRYTTVAARDRRRRAALLSEIPVHHLAVLLVDLCAASASSTVMVWHSSKAGLISRRFGCILQDEVLTLHSMVPNYIMQPYT